MRRKVHHVHEHPLLGTVLVTGTLIHAERPTMYSEGHDEHIYGIEVVLEGPDARDVTELLSLIPDSHRASLATLEAEVLKAIK
jgi:hypothetical protein